MSSALVGLLGNYVINLGLDYLNSKEKNIMDFVLRHAGKVANQLGIPKPATDFIQQQVVPSIEMFVRRYTGEKKPQQPFLRDESSIRPASNIEEAVQEASAKTLDEKPFPVKVPKSRIAPKKSWVRKSPKIAPMEKPEIKQQATVPRAKKNQSNLSQLRNNKSSEKKNEAADKRKARIKTIL